MVGSTVIPRAIAFNFTQSRCKGKCRIAMGTMSMMKQVVNETGAYVLQQHNEKT
jgi:hypothetical protein